MENYHNKDEDVELMYATLGNQRILSLNTKQQSYEVKSNIKEIFEICMGS